MQISSKLLTIIYFSLLILSFITCYVLYHFSINPFKSKQSDKSKNKSVLNFFYSLYFLIWIIICVGLTIAYVYIPIDLYDSYEQQPSVVNEQQEIEPVVQQQPVFKAYLSPSCGWCKKLTEVHGKDPRFIMLNISDHIQDLKPYNHHTQGVPCVVLIKEPEKAVFGFMPTFESYAQAFVEKYGQQTESYTEKKQSEQEESQLEEKQEESQTEQVPKPVELTDIQRLVKDLKLIVFVSDNCGHCKNLKQMLHQHNCLDLVTLLPASHPRLNSCVECANAGGVPCSYSESLKTTFVGCPQNINQYLNMLTDNREVLDNGENLKPKMPTCGKPFRSKNSGNNTYSSVSKMYANASDKVKSYVPQESCY
jgi:thiol-disulfide isomerase/thioredoxin